MPRSMLLRYYKPINQTENPLEPSIWAARAKSLTFWAIVYICSIAAAFTVGRSTLAHPNPIPVSDSLIALRYNRTFSNPPDAETNTAWQALYPKRGTFFTHPPEIPKRSTLSVFHQLHCLDGIRHAYWQALDAAFKGQQILEKDIPMMSSPAHVRHCIDLLRQVLMCHADRTVEEKDDKGGVLGFGTVHKCVDWIELISKIDAWNT